MAKNYADYTTAIPKLEYFIAASKRLFWIAVLFTCMVPLWAGLGTFVGPSFWWGFIIPAALICTVTAITVWFKWVDGRVRLDTEYSYVDHNYNDAVGLLKAYEAYRDEQFLREAGL